MLSVARSRVGLRSLSMFEALVESFPQDLASDKDVNIWLTALKNDPVVLAGTAVASEANFYFRTLLRVSSSLIGTVTLPITYPLSKILKPVEFALTPCPFITKKDVVLAGTGDMVVRRQNIIDRCIDSFTNIGNAMSISRSRLVRSAYRIGSTVISYPLTLLAEPSKESLVMMSIQRYFPDFSVPRFSAWLEESFLPFLISSYVRGRTSDMKLVAGPTVVQERQMAVSELVLAGMTIKSRLFSVSDVEVSDFDFATHLPVISVRCYADHSEHIVNMKGETVVGSAEDVKRTEFLVAVRIDNTGPEPVWKAHELHVGAQMNRI